MLPGKPSQTMVRTAMRRAAHQLLDSPRIFEDPLAVGVIPEASERAILDAADDHLAPLPTLLRSVFALRSRFSEDRLAQAASRGVCQYIILGAGLDTFPWRQPDFALALRIFYVDHPSTLATTMACLRARGLTTPPNVSFVAVDLEGGQLAERLIEHGFACKTGTFCSLLGVTQYLSREALAALFAFAASLPAQSEIVFSFVPPDDELAEDDLAATTYSGTLAETLGEPWKTRLRPSEAFAILTCLGFGEVFHLTPERAHRRYFAGRSDTLRAPRFEQLMAAIA
jgi:methyltransferase (TIGR00027 family)